MDYSRKNQISRQIMNFIVHDQFKEGAQLPTIRDMADMFQVSIDTVQKAVGILKKEGVIEARQGHGLFVKSLHPKTGMSTSAFTLKTNFLIPNVFTEIYAFPP